MSRLALTFVCKTCTLGATLDTAPGSTGLLMVTGGTEIRSGAFGGHSRLAARIAAAGFPVLRFDRRGIGDSEGDDPGFAASAPDIEAARLAFLAMSPQVNRIVGWGNCDAASALMINKGCGLDGLVLSNPWTIEADDGLPPSSAIRARYAAKLANPREVIRLMSGRVNYRKLLAGLARSASGARSGGNLVSAMRDGLGGFGGPVSILLGGADRTARQFQEDWGEDERIVDLADGDHAFSTEEARLFLEEQLLAALRR